MRLTGREIQAIKKAVQKNFGYTSRVLVFGSRIDESKKGGDIDLFIEHDAVMTDEEVIISKLKTMSDIQIALGDQKIDIVTQPVKTDRTDGDTENEPLIIRNARKEGIPL